MNLEQVKELADESKWMCEGALWEGDFEQEIVFTHQKEDEVLVTLKINVEYYPKTSYNTDGFPTGEDKFFLEVTEVVDWNGDNIDFGDQKKECYEILTELAYQNTKL